jgi:hypothetical protein
MDRRQRAVAILALGCFLFAGISTFIDFDCWHQMALAREALALGVPLADQFAYTRTVYPVVHHRMGNRRHDAWVGDAAAGAVAAFRHQGNVMLYAVMWFCSLPCRAIPTEC